MVKGIFIENLPLVPVGVAWESAVRAEVCLLDSGFTGDLQLSPALASEMGLKISGVIRTQVANGQVIEMPTAIAIAVMDGVKSFVQVIISESIPLAGIGLLSKFSYTAIIDCREKTVVLQR